MKPLYEIYNQYSEILNKIENDDDYDFEFFKDTIEGLQGLVEDKMIALASLQKNLEYESANVCDALTQMKRRQTKLQNKIDRIQEFILDTCMKMNMNSITKCPYFTIKVKGKDPKLIIDDQDSLPIQYVSEQVHRINVVDKDLIKKHLKSGDFIPGARLGINKRIEIK